MSTLPRHSTNTDEDIPALQSPSDSSEDEDEPTVPVPRPIIPPRRTLATFDSDDSDMDITESDVRFARGLLRQFEQYTNTTQSRPNQPGGNGTGIETSRLLESLFLSSSSEEEDERGDRENRSGSRRSNTMSPEEMRNQINHIIQQFASLSDRMRDDVEREPDHLRSHVVIDGLEPVSKELLSRYEAVRGEDNPKWRASCAVCYEALDLASSHGAAGHDPTEPAQAENKKLSLALPYHSAFPDVVVFPCLHLFHSECLLPWLARKTTCPTCRFDVDPDSLTLKGGSISRPWIPPAEGVLETWVEAEEKKKLPHVEDALATLGSEDHWSDPDMPSLSSGYETDESTSSIGSFRTCYEGEHRSS